MFERTRKKLIDPVAKQAVQEDLFSSSRENLESGEFF